MDKNKDQKLRIAMLGAGVILGTKKAATKRQILERNANIRQCRTGSLRLPDEIDFRGWIRKAAHKVVFNKRCGERQARSVADLRYFTFRKNFDIAGSARP